MLRNLAQFQSILDKCYGNTIEKISHFENDINLKIIRRKFAGYGEALRRGIDQASGDIVILVEGDATFRSRDIHKMYEYIKDCDMVIGTRTTNLMHIFILNPKSPTGHCI